MREWKTPKGTALYISDLRGKDYLEVKWRLVWFREEHPAWAIETEVLDATATSALVKATIRDDSGRVIATAHKFEDKQGFDDFREKAETGAIGRALAHVGYGTQFAPDMEEGGDVVDSPVQQRAAAMGPARVSGIPRAVAAKSADQATGRAQCEHNFMVSRYNSDEEYCTKCKTKRPRSA